MKKIIFLLILLLALIISSSFVVPEGSYGLKYMLWRSPKNPELVTPGLHFKWPFVQKVILGNAHPQLLLADGSTGNPYLSVQTFDQHHLELGYALVWRITDPLKFYQAQAKVKTDNWNELRTLLNNDLTQSFASLTLNQLLQAEVQQQILSNTLNKLSKKEDLQGIQLIDLMITSATVAETEKAAWLSQTQTQQQTQLDQLRQKTATLTQSLQADADEKAAQVLINGKIQADQIRSQADQEATQIYADAYQKNPAFYEFYHNLQLYKKVLSSKQDVLVLSTKTPFFKSLGSQQPSDHRNAGA